VGLAGGDVLHACAFEERVVFCHDGDGFDVWRACKLEGLGYAFFSQANAAVLRVNHYAADSAKRAIWYRCFWPSLSSA
jgi:hypothetical protein